MHVKRLLEQGHGGAVRDCQTIEESAGRSINKPFC
jgi:hypothetical protein